MTIPKRNFDRAYVRRNLLASIRQSDFTIFERFESELLREAFWQAQMKGTGIDQRLDPEGSGMFLNRIFEVDSSSEYSHLSVSF